MLVGKKIRLRTLREKDLDLLYDLAADVRDMGDHWPLSLPSEMRWKKRLAETGWWEEDYAGLLITDHEGQILGHIVFYKPSVTMDAYELGYRIYRPQHWGQGFMSEAVSMLVSFLFETKTVDRVQATLMPGNTGSLRVLERSGFQFEGTLRQAIFHRGRSRDLLLYSILREESRPLKEHLA